MASRVRKLCLISCLTFYKSLPSSLILFSFSYYLNHNLAKTQSKLASAELTNAKARLLSVKKLTGSTTQSNTPQNASKSAREKLLAVADDEVKQKQQQNLKLKT